MLPSQQSLEILRKAAASVLAYVVLDLFPDVQVGRSRLTDLGFYCDFSFNCSINEDFITIIDDKMHQFCREGQAISSLQMMRENASELFKYKKQFLQSELALSRNENIVDVVKIGEFYDLCSLSHSFSVDELTAFQVRSLRRVFSPEGMEMIRIEGVAFSNKQELKQFIKQLERSKKNDHFKLGVESQFFNVIDENLFWLSQGTQFKELLLEFFKAQNKLSGANTIKSPWLVPFEFYKPFQKRDDHSQGVFCESEDFRLADLSANHALLLETQSIEEHDLPLIWNESLEGLDESEELREVGLSNPDSMELGLFSAKLKMIDRTHLFCSEALAGNLLVSSLQLIFSTLEILGLSYEVNLVSLPGSNAKNAKQWPRGVKVLEGVLSSFDKTVCHARQTPGGWSFGPSIEIKLIDSIGRKWAGPFLAFDYFHSSKIGLQYKDKNGKMQPLVMICRSLFNSLEYIIALLIEKYNEGLPLWLAPEQVRILTVEGRHFCLAEILRKELCSHGLRVRIDRSDRKLSNKIYKAILERIPYTIVIGDQELKDTTKVSVRSEGQGKAVQMTLVELLEKLLNEVKVIASG